MAETIPAPTAVGNRKTHRQFILPRAFSPAGPRRQRRKQRLG
jgi:hypothetical protein